MTDIADRFRSLHLPGKPLLIPNPWDAGSAVLLESQGFQALATTSSGFAATLGRLDGVVTRDEAIEHGRAPAERAGGPRRRGGGGGGRAGVRRPGDRLRGRARGCGGDGAAGRGGRPRRVLG